MNVTHILSNKSQNNTKSDNINEMSCEVGVVTLSSWWLMCMCVSLVCDRSQQHVQCHLHGRSVGEVPAAPQRGWPQEVIR